MPSPATKQKIPHSLDAERTTLGALLLDPEKMIDIAPMLRPEDFFDPVYGAIYRAIHKLYEERKPIDFVTVSEALKENTKVQALGGSAFVADLPASVPTASHAMRYAEIVKEKSMRRELAKIGSGLMDLAAGSDQNSTELVDAAEQQLLKLSQQANQSDAKPLSDLCNQRFDCYSEAFESDDPSAFSGIPTGFPTLDEMLGGLEGGDMVVLAARPSMGKTALALNVARNVVSQEGRVVGVFSLEMSKEQIVDRLVAGELGVDTHSLKRGMISEDQFDRLGGVMDGLTNLPIFIDDDPDVSLASLRSRARRLQVRTGLDLLIIDYLQLIEVTDKRAGENQTQRVSYISKNLKHLARELSCPVVVLSQLNRECEKRNPPIPVLADLRDSGSIEQDADIVLMLYREGYYNEDCERPTVTDVFVRKQRQGPTGRIELDYDATRMQFSPVERKRG